MKSNIEFTDNSDEILELLGQAKLNGLTAIGMKAETYAKEDCPVDTGRLRNSITFAIAGEHVYIGTNVEYAEAVEYGTYKMTARPFLTPAATKHSGEYERIMRAAMESAE